MANEKRLIDANALLETITKNVAENLTAAENVGRIIIAVTNAPTVDAVEVVKCKDCKHTEFHFCVCVYCEDVEIVYCPKHHKHMKADDFCSYGERRTDDGKE